MENKDDKKLYTDEEFATFEKEKIKYEQLKADYEKKQKEAAAAEKKLKKEENGKKGNKIIKRLSICALAGIIGFSGIKLVHDNHQLKNQIEEYENNKEEEIEEVIETEEIKEEEKEEVKEQPIVKPSQPAPSKPAPVVTPVAPTPAPTPQPVVTVNKELTEATKTGVANLAYNTVKYGSSSNTIAELSTLKNGVKEHDENVDKMFNEQLIMQAKVLGEEYGIEAGYTYGAKEMRKAYKSSTKSLPTFKFDMGIVPSAKTKGYERKLTTRAQENAFEEGVRNTLVSSTQKGADNEVIVIFEEQISVITDEYYDKFYNAGKRNAKMPSFPNVANSIYKPFRVYKDEINTIEETIYYNLEMAYDEGQYQYDRNKNSNNNSNDNDSDYVEDINNPGNNNSNNNNNNNSGSSKVDKLNNYYNKNNQNLYIIKVDGKYEVRFTDTDAFVRYITEDEIDNLLQAYNLSSLNDLKNLRSFIYEQLDQMELEFNNQKTYYKA